MNSRLRVLLIIVGAAALPACTALTPGYANLGLNDLFNSERAFARMASTQGITPAFRHYLATDAIVFQPGPVIYARTAPLKPGPLDAAAPVLEWGPQAGAVARAEDLGYTTGPYRLMKRDVRAPLDQGYFFSIWKRVDGVWRVALDAGVATQSPPPQEGLVNFLKPIEVDAPLQPTAKQVAHARDEILARERAPRSLAALPEGMPSYYEWFTTTTRWLRTGPPATFGAAMRHELTGRGGHIAWVPTDAVVSLSNDFAYSYGSFTRTTGDGAVLTGYYVHVWQRDDLHAWKLAVVDWLPAH